MEVNKLLDLDNRPINAENEAWHRAKNILMNDGYKSISPDAGFEHEVTYEFQVIGTIELDKGYLALSTGDSGGTTFFKIEQVIDGVSTTLLRTQYITHSSRYAIEGVFKRRGDDLIIAYSNGEDRAKLINFTTIANYLNASKEFTNSKYAELCNFFPYQTPPIFTVDTNSDTNGTIHVGTHQFCMAYYIGDYDKTGYSMLSNPVQIAELDNKTIYQTSGGATYLVKYQASGKEDTVAAKISLTISNLDTAFEQCEVIVIQRLASGTYAQTLGRFPISAAGTTTVEYDGQYVDTIDLASVIVPTFKFNTCGCLGTFQNTLTAGDIYTDEVIDYQKYANNIKIQWRIKDLVSVETDVWNTQFSTNARQANDKGMMPDEVYALYIHFIMNDGTITKGFHIPGRAPVGITFGKTEQDTIASWDAAGGTPYDNEQSIDDDVCYFHTRNTSTGNIAAGKGDMGFWKNLDETYDSDSTNEDVQIWSVDVSGVGSYTGSHLAGVQVRHHKVPCPQTVIDNANVLRYGIGIRAYDVHIPAEIEAKVKGWFISYAKRDINNSCILDQGYFMDQLWDVAPASRAYTSMRFIGYTLAASNAKVSPRFIKSYKNCVFTGKETDVVDLRTFTANETFINLVKSVKYIPKDYVGDGKLIAENTDKFGGMREDYVAIVNSGVLTTYKDFTDRTYTPDPLTSNIEYAFGSVQNFVRNVYKNFYNQTLIPTSNVLVTAGTYQYDTDVLLGNVPILGFDTFHGDLISAQWPSDILLGAPHAPYIPRSVIASQYSVYNPCMGEQWHTSWYWDGFFNVIYNAEMSRLNDLNGLAAYNMYSPLRNTYENRVIRSNVIQTESADVGWRNFLTNNYKDLPVRRGKIQSLKQFKDSLFIHNTYALFVAGIKNELQAGGTIVYTAEGDIFDNDPKEILSSDGGELGTQSKFAITVSKWGYCFIDALKDEIHIVSAEGVQTISGMKARTFFRDNLALLEPTLDNPYTQIGHVAMYDQKRERLIFGKIDVKVNSNYTYEGVYEVGGSYGVTSIVFKDGYFRFYDGGTWSICTDDHLTLNTFFKSYHCVGKGWVCDHDYSPCVMLSDYDNSYSISLNPITAVTNRGFRHNANNFAIYHNAYQATPTPYPSYVDIIFNNFRVDDSEFLPKDAHKIFERISWDSDVIDSNGVNLYTKTIDKVMLYNDTQCSGYVELTTTDDWWSKQGRFKSKGWYFNKFRDAVLDNTSAILDDDGEPIVTNVNINVKDFFDKSLFVSNFVIVRLYISNSEQYNTYINNVSCKARKSY